MFQNMVKNWGETQNLDTIMLLNTLVWVYHVTLGRLD